MYRLRILIDQPGWCFEKRAMALEKYAPDHWEVTIRAYRVDPDNGVPRDEHDVILLLSQSHCKSFKKTMDHICIAPHPALVTSYNTGWPRYREYFDYAVQHCDTVIVNNLGSWKQIHHPKARYIHSGVDTDIFRIKVPMHERESRVLWCGSILGTNRFRANLKGYDQYLLPMARKLEEQGVPCDFMCVDPNKGDLLDAEEMVDWYNTGTVSVVASEVERAPNVATEASACGCAVVSTRVGCMPELIGDAEVGRIVGRDVDELVDGVLWATEKHPCMALHIPENIASWCWSKVSKEYFQLFDEVVARRAA